MVSFERLSNISRNFIKFWDGWAGWNDTEWPTNILYQQCSRQTSITVNSVLTAAGGRWRCWCRWRRRRAYLTSDCSVAVLLSLLLQSSSPSSSSSSLSQTLVDSTSLPAKPPTSRWWSLDTVPTAPRATDFFAVSDLRLFPTLPFTLKRYNKWINSLAENKH